MTLEQYAYLAEIIGVVGVIASLLYLAVEVRRNTKQSRLSNLESVIDRFNTLWSRTNNLELADIVARGRKDYSGLTESERLAFGHYYEELTITYETMAVSVSHPDHSRADLLDLVDKHLRFHFSFPGVQEWWAEWSHNAGPVPTMTALVNRAISEGAP